MLISSSIIQDCEDALTNWVVQNAAVKPQLSTRARTLSQRRKKTAHQGQPVDLASQDQPMDNRESALWVPASEHQSGAIYAQGHEDEEDEDEDEEGHVVGAGGEGVGQAGTLNGEQRGREEARAVPA